VRETVPNDNEVLVRVHASSVNALDGRPFSFPLVIRRLIGVGLRRPKDQTTGYDLAATVEAVGAAVTQFRPGDEVFGMKRGAFAGYVCSPEERLVPKPGRVSFEAAAAVPVAGLTALQAIRNEAKVQPGQKVLINGAGGGVGTFAVQIARVRRRSDGRLRHEESADGPLDWRRPRHRLHARRLHGQRAALRRDPQRQRLSIDLCLRSRIDGRRGLRMGRRVAEGDGSNVGRRHNIPRTCSC
jgi:hypothetical protein